MGNDIKTAGGYIAYNWTFVASIVTLGQIESVNELKESWFKYTCENLDKSIVGNAAGAAWWLAATAGGALATAATLGQWDAVLDFTAAAAKGTGNCICTAVEEVGNAPIIGHAISSLEYAISELDNDIRLKNDAKMRLKKANESTLLTAGAIVAAAVGPAGIIGGSIIHTAAEKESK